MADADTSLGERFAAALADKDFDRIRGLLHQEVDFRGLTPRRSWEAQGADDVVTDVFMRWLTDSDHVDGLLEVETGGFSDRERVSYSFSGHNAKGPFVVEQQAYFTERDGRIDWMRVLCSGFRPPGSADR